MAGKLSNLGASSSSSKKTVKLEKRKRCATTTTTTRPDEEANQPKPPRPFQLITPAAAGTARPTAPATGAVVPPFHLHHHVASNRSAPPPTPAFPFPMAGVSGAAPLWTTAAMLASRSPAAAALSPPVLMAAAGARGPAAPAAANFMIAGMPPPGAGAAAAAGGQQLVPMPLHFVGYHHHHPTHALPPPPPPPAAVVGVGIPLAAALDSIENLTLGRMLSALTPLCSPPLRAHQSHNRKKSGGGAGAPPPPWWPTGCEPWWAPDLLAHLDANVAAAAALVPQAQAQVGPVVVPFRAGYSLRKAHKVALLVAVVKHLAPDFARAAAAVRHSGKLSASEAALWHSGLANERAKCVVRPVYFVLMPHQQQQQGQQGGGGGAGSGSVVGVQNGSSSACGGGGDGEQVAGLLVPAGADVPAPADNSGREVMSVPLAELVEKEQHGGGGGGVSAADALAGDGRDQQPVNIPAGDDAAAAPGGQVHRQVVAEEPEPEPEMMQQQSEQEQDGDIQAGNGNGDDVSAAAEVQVHVDPVVDDVDAPNDTNDVPNAVAVAAMEEEEAEAGAPEEGGQHWWYSTEELNRMFAEFESFGDFWY